MKLIMKAICVNEPRGNHGLEGYQRNEVYIVHYYKKEQETYYRVFPDSEDDSYSERVGAGTFNKYFKVKE